MGTKGGRVRGDLHGLSGTVGVSGVKVLGACVYLRLMCNNCICTHNMSPRGKQDQRKQWNRGTKTLTVGERVIIFLILENLEIAFPKFL